MSVNQRDLIPLPVGKIKAGIPGTRLGLVFTLTTQYGKWVFH